MKTSEAFKHTLEHLWDGESDFYKSQFICVAAGYAKVGEIVLPIIKSLLGDYKTLECWVDDNEDKGDFNLDNYGNPSFQIKMQATRKEWLESLIKEYELVGD